MLNVYKRKYPKGEQAFGFWIFNTDFLDRTTYIEFYLIKIKITIQITKENN